MYEGKIRKLGQIGKIGVGFAVRGRIHGKSMEGMSISKRSLSRIGGKELIPVIQVKDVRKGREITISKLDRIDAGFFDKRTTILEPRDIVLVAHGVRYQANIVPEDAGRVICSSHLYSITDIANNVFPEYISWYLNRTETIRKLKQVSKGSIMKFVPARELSEFPIIVPRIEIQNDIAKIDQTRIKQNALMESLMKQQNILIDERLDRLINNQQKNYE